MPISPGKKIYFLSDFHLGAPDYESSLVREKKIVKFLDSIEADAAEIFIVGDIFDFWYEYRKVVPKGYTRLLGKLASLTDKGIPIHFFVGNHDMWMSGYFEQELNISVYFEPKTFERGDKKFYIGHGDGLGPGDQGYKFIKKVATATTSVKPEYLPPTTEAATHHLHRVYLQVGLQQWI